MTTINDILISELDKARVPAVPEDELVINQIDASGEFVTRRINWEEIGQSIKDLAGDPNRPDITDQVLFGDGKCSAPSITFKNDRGSGIFRPTFTQSAVGISAGSAEVMRLTHDGSQARVGIGYDCDSMEVPEDALHIKNGGIKVDWSNGLQFVATNGYQPQWTDNRKFTSHVRIGVKTSNPLTFATNDLERGRFTEQGDFAFYGALGVGGYSSDDFIKVDYGYGSDGTKSGSILISNGPSAPVKWMDPSDFFEENVDIISDILINNPDFIENISKNLDYDIITDILLNYPGFIDAIIAEIDIEVDMDGINSNLGELNVGRGLGFEPRQIGIGPPKDFLIVDDTIPTGQYDPVNDKNIKIESEEFVATSELIFANITPLP
jgi:hypothetical protein